MRVLMALGTSSLFFVSCERRPIKLSSSITSLIRDPDGFALSFSMSAYFSRKLCAIMRICVFRSATSLNRPPI